MSIRQLRSGKWIADVSGGFNDDGSIFRRTKTVDTEREAREWEKAFQIEVERRRASYAVQYAPLDASDPALLYGCMTVSEFIDNVFWPAKSNLRYNSRPRYEGMIRRFIIPYIGDMLVKDVKHKHIQQMIDACPTRYVGQTCREVASSILGLAFNYDAIPSNPASKRFLYPAPGVRRGVNVGVVLATLEEHAKLIDHVRRHHHGELIERCVILGLRCGLRPEEVVGLDFENIDLDSRFIEIDQVYITAKGLRLDVPKTQKGFRKVPISDGTARMISEWARPERPCGKDFWGNPATPVILNSHGRRASHGSVCYRMSLLRSETYDDGSPVPAVNQWSLRHSFGTAMALDAKMDLNVLADIMGHEDPSTTRIYIKPNYGTLSQAISAIDFLDNDFT